MAAAPLMALAQAGVSVWLDDLSRDRLTSGGLAAMIADGTITGVTTNPSIFQAALADGDDYADQVAALAASGAFSTDLKIGHWIGATPARRRC